MFIDKPSESLLCGAYVISIGEPCKQDALTNGKCSLHGGLTPVKHGMRTNKAIAEKRRVNKLIRDSRSIIDEVI